VSVGARTQWILADLAPGHYRAAVSAVYLDGTESPLSPVADFEIRTRRHRWPRWIAATLAILASGGTGVVSARAAAPYPPSPVISGITWDQSSLVRSAPGSDLWPVAWAADDNLYTAWGDGGGFGGTNSNGRVSLGVARINGPATGFTTANVFGGVNAEAPATFDGKANGIISVGGVL
jgi:hypothetical protein